MKSDLLPRETVILRIGLHIFNPLLGKIIKVEVFQLSKSARDQNKVGCLLKNYFGLPS